MDHLKLGKAQLESEVAKLEIEVAKLKAELAARPQATQEEIQSLQDELGGVRTDSARLQDTINMLEEANNSHVSELHTYAIKQSGQLCCSQSSAFSPAHGPPKSAQGSWLFNADRQMNQAQSFKQTIPHVLSQLCRFLHEWPDKQNMLFAIA